MRPKGGPGRNPLSLSSIAPFVAPAGPGEPRALRRRASGGSATAARPSHETSLALRRRRRAVFITLFAELHHAAAFASCAWRRSRRGTLAYPPRRGAIRWRAGAMTPRCVRAGALEMPIAEERRKSRDNDVGDHRSVSVGGPSSFEARGRQGWPASPDCGGVPRRPVTCSGQTEHCDDR